MFVGNCRFLFGLILLAPTIFGAGKSAAVNPPLTVLVDFEAPHSDASLETFRQGLNQILGPGGFDVDVKLKQDAAANAQYGQLVIFKMKGSCRMGLGNRSADIGLNTEAGGPLAMAYTSDGQVLHFGEVECDHLRHTLERTLGLSGSLKNQRAYGTAMAVVVAHEVYHMLGNAINHTRKGLTKAALSANELTDEKLSLPPSAMNTMKKYLHGVAFSDLR